MYLHRFPEEFVLCVENKLIHDNQKYRQVFLKHLHTDPSEVKAHFCKH